MEFSRRLKFKHIFQGPIQPDLTCFTSLFSLHFPFSHGHCSIYYYTVKIYFLFSSDGIVCHQTRKADFLPKADSFICVSTSPFQQEQVFFFFFDCGKDIQHEIYLLNKFLSAQYSISNYRRCIVQQISKTNSFYINYSGLKKEEVLPYVTARMNLEDLMVMK